MLIKFNVVVLLQANDAPRVDNHYSKFATNQQLEEKRQRRARAINALCTSLTTLLTEHSSSPTAIVRSASSQSFKRYGKDHTPANDAAIRSHAHKADAIISVDLELEWHHLIRFGSHNHALAIIDRAINNAPTLFTPIKYITLSKAVQRYEYA